MRILPETGAVSREPFRIGRKTRRFLRKNTPGNSFSPGQSPGLRPPTEKKNAGSKPAKTRQGKRKRKTTEMQEKGMERGRQKGGPRGQVRRLPDG